MVNFENSSPVEQPKFQGPLENPDWTDEQNASFDRADTQAQTSSAEIRKGLGLDAPSTHEVSTQEPGTGEVAETLAQQRGGHADVVHETKTDPSLKLQGTTKPESTRQGLGWKGRLSADEPFNPKNDARRFRTG